MNAMRVARRFEPLTLATLALLGLAPLLGGLGGLPSARRPHASATAACDAEVFALLNRQFLLAGLPGIVVVGHRDGGRSWSADAAATEIGPIPRPTDFPRSRGRRRAASAHPVVSGAHASRAPPPVPA